MPVVARRLDLPVPPKIVGIAIHRYLHVFGFKKFLSHSRYCSESNSFKLSEAGCSESGCEGSSVASARV